MRLLFLLLVGLPTLFIFVGIVVARTPWYSNYRKSIFAAQLTNQLGMQVSLGRCYDQSPTCRILSNVVVTHPETEREIVRVREIKASWSSNGWSLVVSQPEFQGKELLSSWKILHDWFLCRPQISRIPMSVTVNDLTIHNSLHTPTMVDVRCSIVPNADVVRATLTYRHAADPKQGEIRIDLARFHRENTPLTQVRLDTGKLRVPCAMLADLFPSVQRLGELASVQGVLDWNFDDSGEWNLTVPADRGATFKNVQWNGLTPYYFTGQFDLAVNDFLIQNGRLVRMKGAVQGGEHGGSVSPEFLFETAARDRNGAITTLGTQGWFNELQSKYHNIKHITYSELAFRFELSPKGLELQGMLQPIENQVPQNIRALLAAHGSTLLFEPMPGTIPIQNLVNLLGGPNSDWANYLPAPVKTETTRLSSIR